MNSIKKKILIADDEQDTLLVFRDMLVDEGYDIVSAVDTEEVLNKVASENPDLLILDLRMPVLGGEKVLEMITTNGIAPDMRVLVVTGFDDYDVTRERIVKKYSSRVIGYLKKPIDIQEFINAIAHFFKERLSR